MKGQDGGKATAGHQSSCLLPGILWRAGQIPIPLDGKYNKKTFSKFMWNLSEGYDLLLALKCADLIRLGAQRPVENVSSHRNQKNLLKMVFISRNPLQTPMYICYMIKSCHRLRVSVHSALGDLAILQFIWHLQTVQFRPHHLHGEVNVQMYHNSGERFRTNDLIVWPAPRCKHCKSRSPSRLT